MAGRDDERSGGRPEIPLLLLLLAPGRPFRVSAAASRRAVDGRFRHIFLLLGGGWLLGRISLVLGFLPARKEKERNRKGWAEPDDEVVRPLRFARLAKERA